MAETIESFLDGDELDAGKALAYLLKKEAVFVNSRPYIYNPESRKSDHIVDGPTIVVFAECNDVFAWGGADAEDIDHHYDLEKDDLYRLLRDVLENETYGTTKYACRRRRMQPQAALVEKLKEDGVWDDWWEALPANPDRTP